MLIPLIGPLLALVAAVGFLAVTAVFEPVAKAVQQPIAVAGLLVVQPALAIVTLLVTLTAKHDPGSHCPRKVDSAATGVINTLFFAACAIGGVAIVTAWALEGQRIGWRRTSLWWLGLGVPYALAFISFLVTFCDTT